MPGPITGLNAEERAELREGLTERINALPRERTAALTEEDDPSCPKVEIVYDGDEPWSYGARSFEKGVPVAIAALNAKSLVLTYPTRFRFQDERHATDTLIKLDVDQAAAIEASRAADVKKSEADRSEIKTRMEAERIERAAVLEKHLAENREKIEAARRERETVEITSRDVGSLTAGDLED